MKSIEQLVSDRLDAPADGRSARELQERLLTDPTAASDVARLARLHADLQTLHQAPGLKQQQQHHRPRPRQRKPVQQRRKPARRGRLLIAALLIIGLLTGWLYMTLTVQQESPVHWQLTGHSAEELSAGSSISVASGQDGMLTHKDGSSLRVQGPAELTLVQSHPRKYWRVSKGQVEANISKQAHHPFFIECPDWAIRVLGTRFRFSVGSVGKADKISVLQGSVEIQYKDEQWRPVAAGESWSPSLFADDFSAHSNNWSPGQVSASKGTLSLSKDTNGTNSILHASTSSKKALFHWRPGLQVRFRYRGTAACHWYGIWLRSNDHQSNFHAGAKIIAGGWQEAVIKLDDLKPTVDGAAPLPDGAAIHHFAIQAGAKAGAQFEIDDLVIEAVTVNQIAVP